MSLIEQSIEMEKNIFNKIYFDGKVKLGIFSNKTISDVNIKYYKYTVPEYYDKTSSIIITEILFDGESLFKLDIEKKLDSKVSWACNNLHGLEKVISDRYIISEIEREFDNFDFTDKIRKKEITFRVEKNNFELFDLLIITPFSYNQIKVRIEKPSKENITAKFLELTRQIYREFYLEVCKNYMKKDDYFNNFIQEQEDKKIINHIDFGDYRQQ